MENFAICKNRGCRCPAAAAVQRKVFAGITIFPFFFCGFFYGNREAVTSTASRFLLVNFSLQRSIKKCLQI